MNLHIDFRHVKPAATPAGATVLGASQWGMRFGMMPPMSTQIAIRLPDEMVAFLDRTVASGRAPSRAAIVASAVEREMRRLLAEQDARMLAEHGSADDLDDVVRWAAGRPELED